MYDLEAQYQKRLGLKNYSSHAYSVTVRTAVSDLSQVETASAQLYQQLQEAVDREIQQTGFLPGDTPPGSAPSATPSFQRGGVGGSRRNESSPDQWNCSAKQQGLIEELMRKHKIAREDVEKLALFRFQTELPRLNKMQASGLIDELIDNFGTRKGVRK